MAWESRSCHFHRVNHMTILSSGLGGEGDGSGDTDADRGGDGDVEGDGGSDNDSSLGNSSSVASFSSARNRFQNGSHPPWTQIVR